MDQGFKDEVVIHGVLNDIDVEVVHRNPDDKGKGFVPQPKRWIVEQVNGTLLLHRRLAPASTTTGPTPPPHAPTGFPSRIWPAV